MTLVSQPIVKSWQGEANLGPGLYRMDLTKDTSQPITFIPVLTFNDASE